MTDNTRKLQDVQFPAQSSDSLASRIVKTNRGSGGKIDGGSVPGPAEQGVERRACDCEYWPRWTEVSSPAYMVACVDALNLPENFYCRAREGDLP